MTELIISPHGLELLKSFEGCKLVTYYDAVGVPTIGYGSTGKHVRLGMRITKEQAEKLLIQDLRRFEYAVNTACKEVPTTQNQFDAMVCFSFNVGIGGFLKSTVLRMHKKGNYKLAAAAFLMWCKAGGKTLKGLLRRRKAEAALYLS
jgi:lysozyme